MSNLNAIVPVLQSVYFEPCVGVHVQNDIHPTSSQLHHDSASQHCIIVRPRVLLDRGATINSEDKFGRTPLHSVVEGTYNFEQYRVRIAQLLLERGADVNAQNEDNRTPLHSASYYGRVEIARLLLDGGATANSKDAQGRTPLHTVADGGDYYSREDGVLVAQLLLECGADVNVTDDDGETPLHLASYFGRAKTVPVLLNAGANAGAQNAQSQTPLHLVSQHPYYFQGGGVGVAQLLLEHGADVNAQDENHTTPSDLASRHGGEIASFLLHYGQ
jgi:ankyrin repeat protein